MLKKIFHLISSKEILDQIISHEEVPICFINAKGYIVKHNTFFSNAFVKQVNKGKHVDELLEWSSSINIIDKPLLEYIEITDTDEDLISIDKLGRYWKLLYLQIGGTTAILFLQAHQTNTDWIYDLPIPCCVVDKKMHVKAFNEYMLPYFSGGQNTQFISHSIESDTHFNLKQFIHSSKIKEIAAMMDRIRSHKDTKHIDVLWQSSGNEIDNKNVDNKVLPNKNNHSLATVTLDFKLLDQNDSKGNFVMFLHDMSEIENMKQQAQKAQHLQILGQLTASVVHDFNNLLTAISGLSSLMQDQLASNHPVQPDIREIQNTTARAQELIQQLLDFSKDRSEQDCNNPVEVMKDFMQSIIILAGHDVNLNINAKAPEHCVELTRSQIVQIIINFIVNARDAGATSIDINMQLKTFAQPKRTRGGLLYPNQYSVLRVSDNGDGIPVAVQDKILEPFFSTKEKGSGLGLATVNRLLQMYNGSLDFESSSSGTTFYAYIPCVDKDANKKTVEKNKKAENIQSNDAQNKISDEIIPAVKADGMYGTILFVEDDQVVRDLTKRALEYHKYNVITAENGEEAIEYISKLNQSGNGIKEQPFDSTTKWSSDSRESDSTTKWPFDSITKWPFDLIITDAVMPKMNGVKFIQELYNRWEDIVKKIPIMLMSGFNPEELVDAVPDNVKILTKPIKIKDLIGAINGVLNHSE